MQNMQEFTQTITAPDGDRPAGRLHDETLACRLAEAAGQLLLAARGSGLLAGRELGSVGDRLSQELMSRVLRAYRPADAVLSEEALDDISRLDASRVWVIDPLDGTREYGEGRDDWAVHVALVIDGAPGPSAVALPGHGQVLTSSELSATQVPAPARRPPRIAVSRSRPPAIAEQVAARVGGELAPMGSAGFKAMAVLTGAVDAYLHAGGQYEWDSAAPVGVALAHGLHASRLDGSPLIYNRPDPLLPDLLICRAQLADQLLEAIVTETAA